MLLMGQAGADPIRVAVLSLSLLLALALTYDALILVESLGGLPQKQGREHWRRYSML